MLKQTLCKVITKNINLLVDDIKSFKTMFHGVRNLVLPLLWDENEYFCSKEEYINKLKDKRKNQKTTCRNVEDGFSAVFCMIAFLQSG